MRSLRFVHLAGDGTALVLETADGGEQFVLAAEPQVCDALLGTVAQHTPTHAAPEPAGPVSDPAPERASAPIEITPREIQIRIRAGESPTQLAESLGTSVERIARFAGPVVEERARIADEARRARARRGAGENRGGEVQLVVFGDVVDERFAAHGVAPSEVSWDTYRRDDGEWVVRADWCRGSATYSATWLFHRSSRTVTPLDEAGTDLLSDRPIRPVMPEPQPVAAGALAAGVVAFPPMPDALTGPLPVVEDVFDQDAAGGLDAPRPLRRDHFALEPVDFEEPPLPLGILDPTLRPGTRLASVRNLGGGKREESDDERAARVKVPSWDDILLGVRRKQD